VDKRVIVDQNAATTELMNSYRRCKDNPSTDCPIKETIDFVLHGKNCLTYRYILITALVAKATTQDVDILSLQASDSACGAYDARSLCSHVIFPFQKQFLGNALDGSNEDPLVNNPARHPRLSKENKSAGGDPKKVLFALCDSLPTLASSDDARICLDYLVTSCLETAAQNETRSATLLSAASSADAGILRRFFSDLLDKNYGGVALTLVATCLYRIRFPESSGYRVVPHPVNESGRSGRQLGDLDVYLDDEPYLATELKDKPFTETEVSKAAETAFDSHAPTLLFIAGRSSGFSDDDYRYLQNIKTLYEDRGMFVGSTTIDALIDTLFAFKRNVDAQETIEYLDNLIGSIGASVEAQRFVYLWFDQLGNNQAQDSFNASATT
jgi:hypothetical protein